MAECERPPVHRDTKKDFFVKTVQSKNENKEKRLCNLANSYLYGFFVVMGTVLK